MVLKFKYWMVELAVLVISWYSSEIAILDSIYDGNILLPSLSTTTIQRDSER